MRAVRQRKKGCSIAEMRWLPPRVLLWIRYVPNMRVRQKLTSSHRVPDSTYLVLGNSNLWLIYGQAHWPKHKAICKALKTLETKHAEELRRPFQAEDELSGEPVGNADLANACISRVSKVEKRVLTERLGRRPAFDEESLMDWQPRCLAW